MDNQQKQSTLRLPQDFQIGQPVTFRGYNGIITEIINSKVYPLLVRLEGIDWTYCFTPDGRYTQDGPVELFRLEESDKPEQVTSEQDTDKAPSLQTFKHIAEWIAKTAQFIDGDWYVGEGFFLNALNIEELHLLYLLKGLEEGTTDVSVGE